MMMLLWSHLIAIHKTLEQYKLHENRYFTDLKFMLEQILIFELIIV